LGVNTKSLVVSLCCFDVVLHLDQNTAARVPGKEQFPSAHLRDTRCDLVERVLQIYRRIRIRTEQCQHFRFAFGWIDNQVDPVKMRPVKHQVAVTQVHDPQERVRDANSLVGIIVGGHDAVMPHPAIFWIRVTAFQQDRETARNKELHDIDRATITDQGRQVGLFEHIIAHFAEHDIAVILMGSQTSFGNVLGAWPAPEGDVH